MSDNHFIFRLCLEHNKTDTIEFKFLKDNISTFNEEMPKIRAAADRFGPFYPSLLEYSMILTYKGEKIHELKAVWSEVETFEGKPVIDFSITELGTEVWEFLMQGAKNFEMTKSDQEAIQRLRSKGYRIVSPTN